MYNHHLNNLGQAPAEPTFLDRVLGVVQTGVTAGFNVYDRVKQLQTAVQTRKSTEELARQVIQAVPSPGAPAPAPVPYQSTGIMGGDWTMPLIVGAGAIGLIMYMRR